jgi:uncharacterized protein (DUF2236 family)
VPGRAVTTKEKPRFVEEVKASLAVLLRPRRDVKPMADYGFFGPDSVSWKVWSYPTGLTVGFQRAVVIEELDPFLLAAVDATSKARDQARIRYDNTIRYFAIAGFADARTATKASEVLMRIHARNVGVEPVSGRTYNANSPETQLWIHLTAWHSILYTYERYGRGRLSAEEEARYWEECAVAAELQTCDPATVPRTREGIRQYFAAVRPRLAASEATQSMMDHLLNAKVMFPPVPLVFRPGAWVVSKFLRWATIATMPRWQRKLAGLRQPRIVDVLIRPVMWTAFHLAALSPRYQLVLLNQLSPSTVPVVEPLLRGVPPTSDEVTTPAEAFARYGYATPAEMYERLHGHGADDDVPVLADATQP